MVNTVTFLTTDVEGATKLLESLGDERYERILSEYYEVLEGIFSEGTGKIVDRLGDNFFLAFASAKDALVTAVNAQRLLITHQWPGGLSVRVRIGLHTGEALVSGGRYVGRDVHRAVRICSAAHGGEILLSQTTYELLRDDLPASIHLKDLGAFPLKGISRSLRLFQVIAPELPAEFPAPILEHSAPFDRVVATIMFTDIVMSTARLAQIGDREGRKLRDRHHELVRRELSRHGGREIDTAGDGFFIAFHGPTQAVDCASDIILGVSELGLEVRVGLHAGEVETSGEKISGLAVAIASRIGALAGASKVLASNTVRELTIGSKLEFVNRGVHNLKGVPGEWQVFSVDYLSHNSMATT